MYSYINHMRLFPFEIVSTGFPKKTARFPKLENIPDLLSDEKEWKIMENIDFTYFSNRASFMRNPVLLCMPDR